MIRRHLPHLVLATALLGLVSCSTRDLVYPGSNMQLPDTACGFTENAIALQAEDGTRLQGWFFNRGPNSPLVAMYGGNAMNVGNFANIAAADTTRSYLLINYRGYGNSAGEPTQQALVADARYCIGQARAAMGNPSAPLYLVGFSLGSGVATQVAATEYPAGLVLVCPFDNMTSVACNVVPFFPRLLPMDSWDSASIAPKITCPVTMLCARYDKTIPTASTNRLIRAFATPPTVIGFDADHNNIFTTAGFLQTLMQAMPVTEQCESGF
ncbi:MAG: alpha/beta fold hydrolase [Akkermansia sp.]|nr:alpha/beta fold hydrolase [Akkermansia sp.]